MVVADPVPADLVGQRGVPWATILTVTLAVGGGLATAIWTRDTRAR